MRLGERALPVDAAAGVEHECRGETRLGRVERRVKHAEIGRQTAQGHALQTALLEIGGETGRGAPVVLAKGRIEIDRR